MDANGRGILVGTNDFDGCCHGDLELEDDAAQGAEALPGRAPADEPTDAAAVRSGQPLPPVALQRDSTQMNRTQRLVIAISCDFLFLSFDFVVGLHPVRSLALVVDSVAEFLPCSFGFLPFFLLLLVRLLLFRVHGTKEYKRGTFFWSPVSTTRVILLFLCVCVCVRGGPHWEARPATEGRPRADDADWPSAGPARRPMSGGPAGGGAPGLGSRPPVRGPDTVERERETRRRLESQCVVCRRSSSAMLQRFAEELLERHLTERPKPTPGAAAAPSAQP